MASLFCMLCLNFPIGYFVGLHKDHGLPGLWVGFGTSCCVLALLYSVILSKLDWKEAAKKAAEDEEVLDENGEVIEIHDFKNAIELTPLKSTR